MPKGIDYDREIRNIMGAENLEDLQMFENFIKGSEWNDDAKKAMDMLEQKRQQLTYEQEASKNREARQQLLDQMRDTTTQYEASLPSTRQRMIDPAVDARKRQLAEQQANLKQQAQRRGLLYSGLKEGAESELKGKYGTDVGAIKKRAHDISQAQLDAYKDLSTEAGLNAQEAVLQEQKKKQAMADEQYNQQLEDAQSSNALTSAALSAGGQVVGTALGGYAGRNQQRGTA